MDFASWARLAPRKLETAQGEATTNQILVSGDSVLSFALDSLTWKDSKGHPKPLRMLRLCLERTLGPRAPLPRAPEPSESTWHTSCGQTVPEHGFLRPSFEDPAKVSPNSVFLCNFIPILRTDF